MNPETMAVTYQGVREGAWMTSALPWHASNLKPWL
jgi:hypothetical protein